MDASKIIASGLVLSHLDYANILYAGLPKKDISKIQRVQSMCAKIVTCNRKYDSSTNSLKILHWLPIELRVKFKILTLVHQCLFGAAPAYLKDLIKAKKVTRRGMRSETNKFLLDVPFTKRKTFADRSFSVLGPKYWNDLPEFLRCNADHGTFKSQLKTHLYTLY